uniref:Uncharacterized protein n=1 Tax=Arundo donax TaxID=35708 RepID=A0A0A9AAF3_ARUDO
MMIFLVLVSSATLTTNDIIDIPVSLTESV